MSIRTELAQGVLTLTFARPEKKNAITQAMYGDLTQGIERAAADKAVRVVMFDAEGPLFSAGNDLADFAASNAEGGAGAGGAPPFLNALARLDKPAVAAVEGRAIGVGFTLLLHCDLVYVATDAQLSAPFVDLGVCPEAGSSLLLPARIGHQRAFSIFAQGRVVDGRTAADWGLAVEAVEPGAASARAREAAQALARKPSQALAVTKRLMRPAGLGARIEEETGLFRSLLATPQAAEAFAAFFERRAPDYSRFE